MTFCVSNAYVVPHNREAKIAEESGAYEKENVSEIDASHWRLGWFLNYFVSSC